MNWEGSQGLSPLHSTSLLGLGGGGVRLRICFVGLSYLVSIRNSNWREKGKSETPTCMVVHAAKSPRLFLQAPPVFTPTAHPEVNPLCVSLGTQASVF